MSERRLPPVTELAMLSLALIIASGIVLSAHIPGHVSLTGPIILVSASAAVLAGAMLSLARVEGFAWHRFWAVFRWALLAYAIIAGLILYAFLRNHLSGGPLVLMTLSLAIFTLDVPVLIGFTVARFDGASAAEPAAP